MDRHRKGCPWFPRFGLMQPQPTYSECPPQLFQI
uniref:Uncharacterized protein n=1 Tax=Arundo donax TaxID=35708 RepID=A0A0A9BZI1_ARUDO